MVRRLISQLWLSLIVTAIVHGQSFKLDYSSYLGGSGNEWGYAVAADSSGAVYIAGFTDSANLPVINALQSRYAGGTGDLFVAKLKPDGSGFAYFTYIGGSGGEGDLAGYVGGIAVDSQGNAYVAGITRSSDFPITPGAFQTSIASQYACDSDPNAGLCGDAFVLKLSPAGDRLLYSTYVGGNDYDDAKAIAIDSTGAAYITGMTASQDFPTTSGAFQIQNRDVDAYVAKLSPDGSRLLYSTLIGGSGLDAGMAIAVDSQGRAYVAGTTQAPDFPTANAFQTKSAGGWDAFILRLNATATAIDFSTFLGGQGTDEALGITLDSRGNIYLAGFTSSPDFPIKSAFQPQFVGGDTNGFVTKLRGDGTAILYSTFLGGADGQTQLNAIAVDSSGSAYVAGQGGSDFPIVNSLRPYGGSGDAVLANVTPDGTGLFFSTFIGGSSADLASAIALDSAGRIVITGQATSFDFPVSGHSFQPALNGPSDAFVGRLAPSTVSIPIFSSPKSLSFGPLYVGRPSASQSITVSNQGTQSLMISSITGSPNVQAISNCANLASHVACAITATLTAATLGDQSGTITVSDNAPDSPQTIFFSGTAVSGGDLELSPLVTGSPFTDYGKTAIPLIATVLNHGPNDSSNVVVTVTSSAGTTSCPCYVGTIKAGASAVSRFNFVPSTYGMIRAAVQVAPADATPDLNSSNNSQTILIANPRYSASPSQLTFNQQIVNLASTTQTITFTSLDQSPLPLSFSTTGDFQATHSCDPGALRCYAYVTFLPTAAGTRAGTLIVTESVGGTMQQIALSGPAILAPHVRLSATALSFANAPTGSPTDSQILTITNDGSAPLFLVKLTLTGNFVQSNHCSASIAPGGTCGIAVSYIGQTAGATGTLTLWHNAPDLNDIVTLTAVASPMMNPTRPSRPSPPATSTNQPTVSLSAPSSPVIFRPSRPLNLKRIQAP